MHACQATGQVVLRQGARSHGQGSRGCQGWQAHLCRGVQGGASLGAGKPGGLPQGCVDLGHWHTQACGNSVPLGLKW